MLPYPIYLNFHVWRDMITDVTRSKNLTQTWKMLFARPSEVDQIKKDFEISASGNKSVKKRSNNTAPIVLNKKGAFIKNTSCSSCVNCRRSYGAVKIKSLAIAIFCTLMVLSGHVRSQDEIRIHAIPTKRETVNVICLKNEHTAIAKSFLYTLLPAGIGIIGIKLSGFSLHGDNDHVQASTLVGSAGLLLYGLYIGPSAGDFYAHDYGSAYGGILARCFGTYMLIRYKKHSRESSGSMRALGCLLIGGSYLYNFLSCRGAVKKYNRINFRKSNLAIMPKFDIRNSNYGFAVNFRFN